MAGWWWCVYVCVEIVVKIALLTQWGWIGPFLLKCLRLRWLIMQNQSTSHRQPCIPGQYFSGQPASQSLVAKSESFSSTTAHGFGFAAQHGRDTGGWAVITSFKVAHPKSGRFVVSKQRAPKRYRRRLGYVSVSGNRKQICFTDRHTCIGSIWKYFQGSGSFPESTDFHPCPKVVPGKVTVWASLCLSSSHHYIICAGLVETLKRMRIWLTRQFSKHMLCC